MRSKMELIEMLKGGLIVSCQDYVQIMVDAAIQGGAMALRINSPGDVRFVRERSDIPIIACNKMHFPNSPVYITPTVRAAVNLMKAGADIVALDCTLRRRPRESVAEIIRAIHDGGGVAMADLSVIQEAQPSIEAGADILSTTLAPRFDPGFLRQLVPLGLPVLAEGQVDTPERAKEAMDLGAWAVCVGTAITRPHLITERFKSAIGG